MLSFFFEARKNDEGRHVESIMHEKNEKCKISGILAKLTDRWRGSRRRVNL